MSYYYVVWYGGQGPDTVEDCRACARYAFAKIPMAGAASFCGSGVELHNFTSRMPC